MAEGLRKITLCARLQALAMCAGVLAGAATLTLGSSASAEELGGSCAPQVGAASVLLAHKLEQHDLAGAQRFVRALPEILQGCSRQPMSQAAERSSRRVTHRSPYRDFAWTVVELVRTTGSTEDALLSVQDVLSGDAHIEGATPNPPGGGGGGGQCSAVGPISDAYNSWAQKCGEYLNEKNLLPLTLERLNVRLAEAINKLKNKCNKLVGKSDCLPLSGVDKGRLNNDQKRDLFLLNEAVKKARNDITAAQAKVSGLLSAARKLANQLQSAIAACARSCPTQRDQCTAERNPNQTCAGF